MEHYEKIPRLIQLTFKYSEAAVFSNFHMFHDKKACVLNLHLYVSRIVHHIKVQRTNTGHFLQKYTSNWNCYTWMELQKRFSNDVPFVHH